MRSVPRCVAAHAERHQPACAQALRWAGLWSFLVLVLRLFFVDLAETSALVRIALLFVSGMVLVGTGILYARRPSGAVGSDP